MPATKALQVRKLADTSDGVRVKRFDPETGEGYLARPVKGTDLKTGKVQADVYVREPWPTLGIELVDGGGPKECAVSMRFVEMGVGEGWIELENPRREHRPGGSEDKPWGTTHTFLHADAIIFKCVDGDVRYRVVGQPDKYHDGPKGTDSVGDSSAQIWWSFHLKKETT